MGERSTFLAVGLDFFPSPRLPIKVWTYWVQQFSDIFGKKVDAWYMIFGDNHAGHGFVLRDIVLTELFQINHNCVTECTLQAKVLLKLI